MTITGRRAVSVIGAALAACLLALGCARKPHAQSGGGAGAAGPASSAAVRDDLSNWPAANPAEGPADRRFEDVPPDKLMPFILGDAHEARDGRPMSQILACATFLWKTRSRSTLRAELADKIAERLRNATERKSDQPYLASFLGPLQAHDHIIDLLGRVKALDCCYGPELLRALRQCWRKGDVPFVVSLMDKETDACRGIVNDMLRDGTAHDVPWTTPEEAKKAWMDWYRGEKPESGNPKPD
jgi:hypothetical protein